MKTMFQVTCITKQGLRCLIGAAQGRNMHETREAADTWLAAFLANNSTDRLASIYGAQALDTFRVDPFECYDHGDPVGIYVEQTECSRMIELIRAEYKRTDDLTAAARVVMGRNRDLAFEVMDRIGSYPSSDPELAALQRVWC